MTHVCSLGDQPCFHAGYRLYQDYQSWQAGRHGLFACCIGAAGSLIFGLLFVLSFARSVTR